MDGIVMGAEFAPLWHTNRHQNRMQMAAMNADWKVMSSCSKMLTEYSECQLCLEGAIGISALWVLNSSDKTCPKRSKMA